MQFPSIVSKTPRYESVLHWHQHWVQSDIGCTGGVRIAGWDGKDHEGVLNKLKVCPRLSDIVAGWAGTGGFRIAGWDGKDHEGVLNKLKVCPRLSDIAAGWAGTGSSWGLGIARIPMKEPKMWKLSSSICLITLIL